MTPVITDADLHALVDGELSGRRLGEVRQHVAQDINAALQVQRWAAARDSLRAMLQPIVDEPLPLRLTLERIEPSLARDREAYRRLLFALGFVSGLVVGLGSATLTLLR
ncbi:MAG: hypothetical protein ABWZ80_10135 [Beijerinckiaceae bacterium]